MPPTVDGLGSAVQGRRRFHLLASDTESRPNLLLDLLSIVQAEADVNGAHLAVRADQVGGGHALRLVQVPTFISASYAMTNLAGVARRNLSASSRLRSTEMATIVKPSGPYLACMSFMNGNDNLHGTHHEAQKSTYTT